MKQLIACLSDSRNRHLRVKVQVRRQLRRVLISGMAESGTPDRRQSRPQTGTSGGRGHRSASEHKKPFFKRSNRRSLSSQSHRREASEEDATSADFYLRVNCPFCWKPLKEKLELVKHLDDGCRIRRGEKSLSTFQIFPDNRIKCMICCYDRRSYVFDTVPGYLQHLRTAPHVLKRAETVAKGKRLTEFLYCSACYMTVPDNQVQLEFHLRHRNHQLRTTGAHQRSWKEGIQCVYCCVGRTKMFRCLSCSPENNTFDTPTEMMKHLKMGKHSGGLNCSKGGFHCCFCEKGYNAYEIPFHLTSPGHLEEEKKAEERYELCIFCGFSCSTLGELSTHMRGKCREIDKFRPKEMEDRKNRCVLIKDDVNLVLLLRTLKKFGQIKSVLKHDDEYHMFEFSDAASITYLYLAKNLLKVDGKVLCLKFPNEKREREKPETSQTENPKS